MTCPHGYDNADYCPGCQAERDAPDLRERCERLEAENSDLRRRLGGYDRKADCGCWWSSRNHGDTCPEHGRPGVVVLSLLEQCERLREIAGRMAADCWDGDGEDRLWCTHCSAYQPFGRPANVHTADCPVRQLAEMTG